MGLLGARIRHQVDGPTFLAGGSLKSPQFALRQQDKNPIRGERWRADGTIVGAVISAEFGPHLLAPKLAAGAGIEGHQDLAVALGKNRHSAATGHRNARIAGTERPPPSHFEGGLGQSLENAAAAHRGIGARPAKSGPLRVGRNRQNQQGTQDPARAFETRTNRHGFHPLVGGRRIRRKGPPVPNAASKKVPW